MSSELWVLLWSRNQNALHIERLAHTLSANRKAYRDDRPINDFHVLHVGSMDECSATADSVRSTIHAREKARFGMVLTA